MKIESIQILRGGAAWMVVAHHFMQRFYNFEDTNMVGNFFSNHGSFGVDIFFVISGFIMAMIIIESHKNSKEFILNRIIRIVPNYWFWTFVVLIMGVFIPSFSTSHVTFESLFKSLFFISHLNPERALGHIPTLTVGWTLNIEIFFYVVVAVSLVFKIENFKKLLFISVLLVSLPILYKIFGLEFYKTVAGNIRLFEFVSGIFLYYIWANYRDLFFQNYIYIAILSIVSIISMIVLPKILAYIVLSFFIVYLALFFEINILNHNSYFKNKLIKMGEISYSIYLVHIAVLWSFFTLFNEVNAIYLLPIILLSVYVISIYSYKIIEIYFSKKLKKVFMK